MLRLTPKKKYFYSMCINYIILIDLKLVTTSPKGNRMSIVLLYDSNFKILNNIIITISIMNIPFIWFI